MLYWNCCLITGCLVITEANSKSLWSNLRLLLLTRQFGGVNSSKGSQVCHIIVYDTNYSRKNWQNILFFFQKKHGKHDDHTIIMRWIMENMVIIPWSCHESWRPCWETWPPCRYQGMIMTMFRHDHGMIMAWHPCFSNPGWLQIIFFFLLVIFCYHIVNKCYQIL